MLIKYLNNDNNNKGKTMRKLTKISLAILTSFAMISSAVLAGEFTVSGAVKGTYSTMGSDSVSAGSGQGKGLGLTNEFTLGAAGELDNGWAWTYAQDIDNATVQDDAKLTMATDYGTVGLFISEGSLSQKYKFDNSAYGIGSDTGYGGSTTTGSTMTYGTNLSSYNNLQYHLPSGILPQGGTFKIGYSPQAKVNDNASGNATGTDGSHGDKAIETAISFAPTDALYIGASYFEEKGMVKAPGSQSQESGSLVGNFTQGPIGVGIGMTKVAVDTATARSTEHAEQFHNVALSLGYAVNDNLSVSFAREKSERHGKTTNTTGKARTEVEMVMDTVQAAYTMGGMVVSISRKEVEADTYTLNKDTNETILAFAMEF